MITEGPVRRVGTKTHRKQVYRVKSRVRVLMQSGVPCNEEYVINTSVREPALSFYGTEGGSARDWKGVGMRHNGHRMNPAAGRFLAAMRGAFDRPEPRKRTERRATATIAEIVTREVLRAAKPATTAIQ